MSEPQHPNKRCEIQHTTQEWINLYQNKLHDFESQNQILQTIQNLQTAAFELTKLLQTGTQKEISDLKEQINNEQSNPTTNTNTQT